MPIYTANISITKNYHVEIEADSEEEAEDIANDMESADVEDTGELIDTDMEANIVDGGD